MRQEYPRKEPAEKSRKNFLSPLFLNADKKQRILKNKPTKKVKNPGSAYGRLYQKYSVKEGDSPKPGIWNFSTNK